MSTLALKENRHLPQWMTAGINSLKTKAEFDMELSEKISKDPKKSLTENKAYFVKNTIRILEITAVALTGYACAQHTPEITAVLTGTPTPRCPENHQILPADEPGIKCTLPNGKEAVYIPNLIPQSGFGNPTEASQNAQAQTQTAIPTSTETPVPTDTATATATATATKTPTPIYVAPSSTPLPPEVKSTVVVKPTTIPATATKEAPGLPADWPAWIRQHPEYGWTKIDDNAGGHWATQTLSSDVCQSVKVPYRSIKDYPYDSSKPQFERGKTYVTCVGGVNGFTVAFEYRIK